MGKIWGNAFRHREFKNLMQNNFSSISELDLKIS
jgi:hypothetical protein